MEFKKKQKMLWKRRENKIYKMLSLKKVQRKTDKREKRKRIGLKNKKYIAKWDDLKF